MNALPDVNVLDISKAGTGPGIAMNLGSLGAEVIKVESMAGPDIIRLSLPYKDGVPGVNRSGQHNIMERNKYGMGLDLTKDKSGAILDRLVAWANVVIQSLPPTSSKAEEFGYERFSRIKPDIVYINCTIGGENGPRAKYKGVGHNAAALSGFSHLVGWPDRDGSGMPVAFTDFLAIMQGTIAVMAALDYHRRTGEGQFIELNAYEVGITAIRSVILDCSVNQHNHGGKGNRSESAAPHGVYRCSGEDRWCAIAVLNDEQWQSFVQAIGNPEWAKDSRFSTFIGRKENEDELDGLIEKHTVLYSAEELKLMLLNEGVPAGVVNTLRDITEGNPYITARERLIHIHNKEMGEMWTIDQMPKLSKTPPKIKSPAHCLGEHTEYVCCELLKMSDEEFIELLNEGVIE